MAKEPTNQQKPKQTPTPKPEEKPKETVEKVTQKTPQPQEKVHEQPKEETKPKSHPSKEFNLGEALDVAQDYIKNYQKILDTAKATASIPKEFFQQVKDQSLTKPVGFFLVMLGITLIFTFIQQLFAAGFVVALTSTIVTLIITPIVLVIAVAIVHFILKLLGAKSGFEQTFKIGLYASWLSVISTFPLWPLFGIIIATLVSCACTAVGAYIWIMGAVVLHDVPQKKATLVIGGLAALIILMSLSGAFTASKTSEEAKQLQQQTEMLQKQAEQLQKQLNQ